MSPILSNRNLVSAGDTVHYLDVGGLHRRYVVHIPPGLEGEPGLPAVIMLDGRGGTPWTAMKSSGWSRKADAEHFLAVYPEATRLHAGQTQHYLTNPQMWNAGVGSTDSERLSVDDVEFLIAVIDDVRAQFDIDERRVYMTGFSNGAAMTFRFAIEAPELVAAIGPVAGHFRMTGVTLRQPVPTIYLFGKSDPLNPFDGGAVHLPWGATETRPPVSDTVSAWARLLNLDAPDGNLFVFHPVEGLGHVWPGGHRLLPEKMVGHESDALRGTDVIWDFFSRHTR